MVPRLNLKHGTTIGGKITSNHDKSLASQRRRCWNPVKSTESWSHAWNMEQRSAENYVKSKSGCQPNSQRKTKKLRQIDVRGGNLIAKEISSSRRLAEATILSNFPGLCPDRSSRTILPRFQERKNYEQLIHVRPYNATHLKADAFPLCTLFWPNSVRWRTKLKFPDHWKVSQLAEKITWNRRFLTQCWNQPIVLGPPLQTWTTIIFSEDVL